MSNPWLSVPADDYDAHMAHPATQQREFLDRVFSEALSEYKPGSVAFLGCATGAGLEYIDSETTCSVTAVDLSPEYVEVTRSRFAERLPQLKALVADLEVCELDARAYDLVHCALVLEYVDPKVVLRKMAGWLAPAGVLVLVLQLHSPEVTAVAETGRESLKLLEPLMRLHDPDDIRKLAMAIGLRETSSTIERLPTGKRFYTSHFHGG